MLSFPLGYLLFYLLSQSSLFDSFRIAHLVCQLSNKKQSSTSLPSFLHTHCRCPCFHAVCIYFNSAVCCPVSTRGHCCSKKNLTPCCTAMLGSTGKGRLVNMVLHCWWLKMIQILRLLMVLFRSIYGSSSIDDIDEKCFFVSAYVYFFFLLICQLTWVYLERKQWHHAFLKKKEASNITDA